jgi:hypothetical protein
MAAALAFFAPFAAMALGALGAVLAAAAWIRAMLRSKAWHAEPNAVEGAVAVSGALLLAWGVAVVVFGAHVLRTEGEVRVPPLPWPSRDEAVGSRSTHYSDPERQQALKDALTKAGIPYTLRQSDGKEFVAWKPEHNAAVEAIKENLLVEGPLPAGRTVRFPDPEHERRFVAWLDQKGVQHKRVHVGGEDYIVWQEGAGNLMDQYMADRSRHCPKTRC